MGKFKPESPINLMVKPMGFRSKFSLKPIQWVWGLWWFSSDQILLTGLCFSSAKLGVFQGCDRHSGHSAEGQLLLGKLLPCLATRRYHSLFCWQKNLHFSLSSPSRNILKNSACPLRAARCAGCRRLWENCWGRQRTKLKIQRSPKGPSDQSNPQKDIEKWEYHLFNTQ